MGLDWGIKEVGGAAVLKFMWAVEWIPLWECPSGKEAKMCHICDVIYCTLSVLPLQNVENTQGWAKRVVPRLCELAPRGQRDSGSGIHAT